ncbi:unannotated protein [freshwater metagenome]|uniref:Unannotated protein n=1 Tax=freshwater metagenome TaxID=449393 RepID=A0A6J6VHC2_9ZZZZ
MLVLVVGREVNDVVRDDALNNWSVRGLDESETVDTCKGCEVTDKTNVWSFWGLDRAHTSVVRGVHVSNLETSTLTAKTTGSKGRETALVGEPCKWVRLVHELAELRRSEELLH